MCLMFQIQSISVMRNSQGSAKTSDINVQSVYESENKAKTAFKVEGGGYSSS